MNRILLFTAISIAFQTACYAEESTYDLILKGKKCEEANNQQLECNYKIDNDFWLSVAGVGGPDAGVTFMKSDFNGKYYGSYGMLHECVIVKTGTKNKTINPLNFAFVSPKNGKVYKDWESCKAGY
jgi:hypothetical protein